MNRKHPQPKPLAVALFAVLASMSSLPVMAQDAAPAKSEEPKTLATITVTAQKREEALQDVPVVVTALSQEVLQDAGVRDVKDLQNLVPGLTVTSTQSEAQTTARIRGIGTVGDNPGLESSVGVVIDGVYRPRNGVGFGDLGELERIEVLKGPQGTLFGKNTSAGVINVVTKRPDFVTSGEVELSSGNYGALGLSGSLNLPVGDNTAFRIYAAKRSRDGFLDVHTGAGPRTETDDFNQDFGTVRAQFRWDATDNLSLNFFADGTDRDEDCCGAVTIIRGPTAPLIDALSLDSGVAPVADPYAREAWSNRSTEQRMKDRGVGLQMDWTTPWFGGATLTSVTSKRDWSSINGLDFDYTTADIVYRDPTKSDNYTAFDTFSQEFRLTGATDTVDWLVGAFYSNEDLDRNESYNYGGAYEPYLSTIVGGQVLAGLAAGVAPYGLTVNTANPELVFSQTSGLPFGTNYAGVGALDTHRQSAKSTGLFTNNTWHATDALDLTLGLRYTMEDKDLVSHYSNPNGGAACGSVLANTTGHVGALIASRINNFALLPPATQQALLASLVPALAPGLVGAMCLPWANPLHNGRVTSQSREEKEWSGTLKAAYRWNEHAMTYLSAARGYKAGGFNLDRVQSNSGLSSGGSGIVPVLDTSFPGEFVDSYELGAKTTWMGGNLLLNAALFHQEYTDFQLNSFLGTSFVVRSIPKVTSQGVDAEVLYQHGGLFLQGGVTYTDTKYGDTIPGCDFVGPSQVSPACPAPGRLYLLPGNTASFAPNWSLTAAIAYEFEVGDSMLGRLHLGAKHMSEYNTGSDLAPQKLQPAYTTVDARVSLGGLQRNWAVELWAQNLTDAEYMQVAFDAPLQSGSYNAYLGQPRTYGATFRWRF